MIGEIRDLETAQIAVQASLTGHLVLATLHTNDAAGAVVRLVDMGIEPFLVASSLLGVLAERLVRRLCPACRRPHEPIAPSGTCSRTATGRAGHCLVHRQRLRGLRVHGLSGPHRDFRAAPHRRRVPAADPRSRLRGRPARARAPRRHEGPARGRAALGARGETSLEEVLRVSRE